ncbi:MAG: methylated-DNA--[protein]-cysteine S-methyltransferase [Bacteroidetes bacterium]|nr:MAG: methylated-DNA--[protein]-cysteine S-methyltransferase [Bacteroidota bacterium]
METGQIIAKTYYDTPVGPVEIVATAQGIASLSFQEFPTYEINPSHDFLLACIEQLDEYFQGRRTLFNLFLDMEGTEFQRRVWRELQSIPLGHTATYLDIAKRIQSPDAVRAVGSACGRNRHWLLVPCHRVIGSNGQLTGYAGGLHRKRWLLEYEWSIRHGKQAELF